MCKVLKLKNNSSQNIVLFITAILFECYISVIYIFLRNIKYKIQFWLVHFAFYFYIVSIVQNFKHVVLDVLVTTL